MTVLYLDNSSTTRPSSGSISAMMPYWTTYWGASYSPHQKGQELHPFLSRYFQQLYTFIGAKEEDQLVLTSSGTEAVNQVFSSVYRDLTIPTGKNHFLTVQTDEAAAIMASTHLTDFGCLAKTIPVNAQGIATPQAVADCLSPRTALLSLSWANGLTGVIQPLTEIAALCKQRGVRFHIEATHVMGKLLYDLQEIQPDYLTVNGDQLHAPKGTGILYIRKGVTCSPLLFGSADQNGLRGGGIPMSQLAGLAYACQETLEHRDVLCTEIARLRNHLEKGILKGYPKAQICFKQQERLPHCTTILFPGVVNEALLFHLNRRQLCACMGGGNFQQLALLLRYAGIEENVAHSALSFSLSRYTTEEEIDRAIQIIVDTAESLAHASSQFFQSKE
jgi:cysteine desulfurase